MTQTQSYSVATRRKFLEQMLTIRRAEEQVIHFATDHKDLIRGHYHVYIGQEATGIGACAALGPDDYVFTTHRNHGHVIARGGELGPVLAEIIGRTTGYNRGRGGTFHVIAPHLGISADVRRGGRLHAARRRRRLLHQEARHEPGQPGVFW